MIFEVDKKWPLNMYPDEGVVFEYMESGPMLILFYNKPTAKEIEDIKSYRIAMGYYVKGPVIFIVVKIGSIWMDADEVIRLKQITGLAALFKDNEFSKSWEVG